MGHQRVNPRQFKFVVPAAVGGTVAAVANSRSAQLEAADVTADDQWNGHVIVIVGGTPATAIGQVRRIINTDNATDTITIDEPWAVNPGAATSTYLLYLVLEERDIIVPVTAATANSVTLGDPAAIIADFYNNLIIDVTEGTGGPPGAAGPPRQQRMIVDYSTTRVATVNRPWTVNPAAGSVCRIHGHLRYKVADLKAEMAGAVAFDVSNTLGGLGMGMFDTTTQYGPFDGSRSINTLELSGTGVAIEITRWE